MDQLLKVEHLSCGYGSIPVLRNVDLEVGAGELVAVLGPNGAGKTTTLMAIAGELPISSGSVNLFGSRATGPLQRRVRAGLGLVTDERSVFKKLSVVDNLRVGEVAPEACFALFPELEARAKTLAGDLSGGEQQMLTLGRALAREPRLLLADELSLGLAPIIVDRLLTTVRQATKKAGVGALIVEQHVGEIMTHADRVYVMVRGSVEYSGSAAEFKKRRAEIEASYLGGTVTARV
jgi:branched-chain amino acid transport system ATP-binding protein